MKKNVPVFPIAAAALLLLFFLHLSSLTLVWDSIVPSEQDAWVTAALPAGAVQVREAESQAEVLRQSLALTVPLFVLFIGSMVRMKKKAACPPDKLALVLGAAVSFLLQPVHEFLHGFALPPGSEVHIGIIKENFSAYASSSACMSLPQCALYYLLPCFILGIVPLLVFFAARKKGRAWCWFFYTFAFIGLVQTAPDWFAFWPVLRQVPAGAVIQMSGWHTYWYL